MPADGEVAGHAAGHGPPDHREVTYRAETDEVALTPAA